MSRQEVDLERALADLGAHLEYPATPDLAAAVAARLREAPGEAPAAAPAGQPAAPGRRARSRLADLLRPRLDLGLGERVTLAEARRRVGFPVLVPTAAGFRRPDAVFVNQRLPVGGRVDLVYRARPGLPASPFTDAGLLVTQFRGQLTADFIKKVVGMGVVEEVTVAGEPGYWFSGEPHFFSYRDAAGGITDERTRLAGNTLVWQRGEQTLRLEGQLSKEEALRIAASMR